MSSHPLCWKHSIRYPAVSLDVYDGLAINLYRIYLSWVAVPGGEGGGGHNTMS